MITKEQLQRENDLLLATLEMARDAITELTEVVEGLGKVIDAMKDAREAARETDGNG